MRDFRPECADMREFKKAKTKKKNKKNTKLKKMIIAYLVSVVLF